MPPRLRQEPISLDHVTEAELAWIAGVYEGEGCLTHNKKCWSLRVGMTDRDVIDRLQAMTGMGRVTTNPREKQGGKPYHTWSVSAQQDLATLVNRMLPWMGERRRARALEYLEWFAEWRQLPYVRNPPTHCRRGQHPYEGNRGSGSRCKACAAEKRAAARKPPATHCQNEHAYLDNRDPDGRCSTCRRARQAARRAQVAK